MRWLLLLGMGALTWHSNPLAALISFQTLTNLLNNYGYIAVTLIVMIESSGIPLPGETMLLLASFTAGADPHSHLSIPFVIACAALGAIVGDNIGYYVGRTWGRAFVQRFGKYLFLRQDHLDRAEKFFAKHGDKTVFFGRFIAVLRAWAAFLAGVNHMHWRTFFIYNAAGGIVWATIFGTLGYLAGRFLHENFAQVEKIAGRISLWGAIVIVVVAVAAIVIVRLRRARHFQSQLTAQTSDEKARPASDEKMEPTNEAETAPTTHENVQPVNNGKVEPPLDTSIAPAKDEMIQPANNGKPEPPVDTKVAPAIDDKGA